MSSENLVYKINNGLLNKSALEKGAFPSSKSVCNRALMIGALSGKCSIYPLSTSSDSLNLINAFNEISLKFKCLGNKITFFESFESHDQKLSDQKIYPVHAFDGGTTSRFLMAMLASGTKNYHLILSAEMLVRPMDELIDVLRLMGAKIQYYKDSVTQEEGYLIKGPFSFNKNHSAKFEIKSERSSQFYTALKLLTVVYKNLEIIPIDLKNSKKYADLTEKMIEKFCRTDLFKVPYDFSSLGYIIAFLAINGGGNLPTVNEIDYEQADSALFDILQSSGARFQFTQDFGLTISSDRKKLTPFIADAAIYPDLIPTLAFLAAHIDGESQFMNLEILTHKESNRLKELIFLLQLLEVEHSYDESQQILRIKGNSYKTYRAIEYFPPNDHRMIMTAGVFMRMNYGGILYKAEHVKKSFPEFFQFLAD